MDFEIKYMLNRYDVDDWVKKVTAIWKKEVKYQNNSTRYLKHITQTKKKNVGRF